MVDPLRRKSPRLVSFGIVVSAMMLVGCGALVAEGTPESYVGNWVSTDGNSFITLSDDRTGTFTLCEPDEEDDGLRYNFVAENWPATVAVEWAKAKPTEDVPSGRLYLYPDWDLRQETGVGFGTGRVILDWINGGLEMGADLVVRFQPTAADPSCKD